MSEGFKGWLKGLAGKDAEAERQVERDSLQDLVREKGWGSLTKEQQQILEENGLNETEIKGE